MLFSHAAQGHCSLNQFSCATMIQKGILWLFIESLHIHMLTKPCVSLEAKLPNLVLILITGISSDLMKSHVEQVHFTFEVVLSLFPVLFHCFSSVSGRMF